MRCSYEQTPQATDLATTGTGQFLAHSRLVSSGPVFGLWSETRSRLGPNLLNILVWVTVWATRRQNTIKYHWQDWKRMSGHFGNGSERPTGSESVVCLLSVEAINNNSLFCTFFP